MKLHTFTRKRFDFSCEPTIAALMRELAKLPGVPVRIRIETQSSFTAFSGEVVPAFWYVRGRLEDSRQDIETDQQGDQHVD